MNRQQIALIVISYFTMYWGGCMEHKVSPQYAALPTIIAIVLTAIFLALVYA